MKHYYIVLYQDKKIKWRYLIAENEQEVYRALNIGMEDKIFYIRKKLSFSFYRKKYLLSFTKEFLFLLKNGLSYLEALKVMQDYDNNAFKRKILDNILNKIRQGKSMTESFASNSPFFRKFFLNVLYIGEESGNIENALELLISEMEQQQKLKKQLSSILFYPCFLIFFSFVILSLLLYFVFPKLLSLFQDTGMQLPFFTRILLKIKYFLPVFLLIFSIFSILLYWIFSRKYDEKIQCKIDKFIFHYVYQSGIYRKILSLQISNYLEILLKSGFSFQETFAILEKEIENLEFKKRFSSMKKRIYKGEKVYHALRELGIFSQKDLYFLALGEESGNIDEIFHKIARYTREEIHLKIQKYLSWLEPSIFIIFGLCIGAVIIAVYLPIFSLSNIL
ncbi:type II secretion system F family protein [Fusobacterium necrophorum subsp. funduliforme]|uniref:type II secretion system F family protein n=1 Tax=Fusobacterium necrophorum TaxID=859 RepID=UPI000D137C00|nr:type II secretion system F family protein [Fusobacterium necrophorum]AVQ20409.1 type II secretion system F family protein [Fusobacterium necrophorum subsp. funduliforme]MBR8723613.1 putative type II secretion system protein F [Fusobacterium necrophorum subsp. funduliforme]